MEIIINAQNDALRISLAEYVMEVKHFIDNEIVKFRYIYYFYYNFPNTSNGHRNQTLSFRNGIQHSRQYDVVSSIGIHKNLKIISFIRLSVFNSV